MDIKAMFPFYEHFVRISRVYYIDEQVVLYFILLMSDSTRSLSELINFIIIITLFK